MHWHGVVWFSGALWDRKKILIFFGKKGPVMASLHRSRRCYRARMSFNHVPTKFLLAIHCAIHMLSQRLRCMHCTSTVLTMHALRFHGVSTSLTVRLRRSDISKDDHGVCTTTQAAPAELLLHCSRPYCAAMVTLRWPHCPFIRMPSNCICFGHAQSVQHRLAFYAIPQRLLAMLLLLWCLRSYCTHLSV